MTDATLRIDWPTGGWTTISISPATAQEILSRLGDEVPDGYDGERPSFRLSYMQAGELYQEPESFARTSPLPPSTISHAHESIPPVSCESSAV